jgi:hypothetical protein
MERKKAMKIIAENMRFNGVDESIIENKLELSELVAKKFDAVRQRLIDSPHLFCWAQNTSSTDWMIFVWYKPDLDDQFKDVYIYSENQNGCTIDEIEKYNEIVKLNHNGN